MIAIDQGKQQEQIRSHPTTASSGPRPEQPRLGPLHHQFIGATLSQREYKAQKILAPARIKKIAAVWMTGFLSPRPTGLAAFSFALRNSE